MGSILHDISQATGVHNPLLVLLIAIGGAIAVAVIVVGIFWAIMEDL